MSTPSGKVWQLQPVDGVVAPITPADLAQFQRAATIRDLFFAGGGTTPSVRFDIAPVSLDPGAKQATLDLDGTDDRVDPRPAAGDPDHLAGAEPDADGAPCVRPAARRREPAALQETGPWAMFRMFGRARMQQADSPERYTLTFQVGDREAVFEIRAGSVLNPFAAGVLQDFRCPNVQ